jgi:hypothetical protein
MASRALTAALALIVAAAGIGAERAAPSPSGALAIADWLVGASYVAAAITLASRKRRGALIAVLVAAAWYAGTLSTASGWLGQLGTAAVLMYRAPLLHLVALPLPGRVVTAAVITAYLAVAAPSEVAGPLTVVLAVIIGLAGVQRSVRLPGDQRRAAAARASLAIGLAVVWAIGTWSPLPAAVLAAALDIALVVCAAVVVLVRGSTWAAATRMLIDLGPQHTAAAPVTAVVARALSVPTLRVIYRAPAGAWADELGNPSVAPPPDSVSADTPDGGQVALVDCPADIAASELAKAAAASAALAFADARALAQGKQRAEEVRTSRHRLLDVADSERRAIQARVRGGPLSRLARLRETLTDLHTSGTAELLSELDVGVAELDRIAEGLYPDAILTGPIEDQVRILARRFQPAAAVTVRGNGDRLQDSERVLAHFFCAECLTNSARYAPGAPTAIDIEFSESELRIRVTDKGPGGAVQRPGGGLEGLSDRLQTAGGRLSLLSPVGGPTVVTASLPLS